MNRKENIIESNRKDNIDIMSSSVGINDQSFGNGPTQVSPQAFEGDEQIQGGAIKPSSILSTIAGVAGPTAALAPVAAPIALPIAAIAGIGSQIAKLFGGGLTQGEVDMIHEIKRRVDSRRDMRGVVGSPAN